MAYHKLGETDLSGLGTSNQFLAHGVHGIPAAANFFDQEGSAYTGELEDALMQGVVSFSPDGDRKPFFAARPSQTLEIFPSWLMSFQQTPRGNSELAESTDSGSAHNATVSAQLDPESPMSRMASGRPPERKQQEMARVAPRTGTATANCHPPKLQDKVGRSLRVPTRRVRFECFFPLNWSFMHLSGPKSHQVAGRCWAS
uniref:30S ribosomal protein S13P n=1 Tax=Anthurium amnicola TaxID=1678845 RepID=A0A1D1ZGT7_9ARAE